MAKRRKGNAPATDENYVSVWFWMFAQFIILIPLVGWVMIFVWAYTGENESRKNYFRAIIIWWLLFIAFVLTIIVLGKWPEIRSACEHVLKLVFP
jgi:uncharacterized membrane protein